MVVLGLDAPELLGTVDVVAPAGMDTTATLDVANYAEPNINFGGSFVFGFGVDENDPLTDWRFNTGELSLVTIAPPVSVALFPLNTQFVMEELLLSSS